jgi:hypothetical protein
MEPVVASDIEKNSASSNQPSIVKVGECLYRHSNGGTYYALVKKNGKQIRKSIKATKMKGKIGFAFWICRDKTAQVLSKL